MDINELEIVNYKRITRPDIPILENINDENQSPISRLHALVLLSPLLTRSRVARTADVDV
jgi:hypothetical protein